MLRALWPKLERRVRRGLVLSAIYALLLGAIEAAGVALLVPLMASLTSRPDAGPGLTATSASPLVLAGLTMAAFLLRSALAVLYLRWNLRFVLQAEAVATADVLHATLRAPLPFHLHTGRAKLQRMILDGSRVTYGEGLIGTISAVAEALLLAMLGIVLLVAAPAISAVGVAYFAGVALAYQALSRARLRRAVAAAQHEISASYELVSQTLAAVKEVKLSGSERFFAQQLQTVRERFGSYTALLLLLNQLPRYYLETALVVGVALLTGGLLATRDLGDALPVLGLFVGAGLRVLPSLNRLIVGLNAARAGHEALQDTRETFANVRPEDACSSELDWPQRVHLELRRVTLTYPGGARPAVNDVSIELPAGDFVALVGRSGSGKSTTADIVLGLLVPEQGDVLADGRSILLEGIGDWRRAVGYVPQQIPLISGSIADNVAFGRSRDEVDISRVEQAISLAHLEEVIERLPHGVNTELAPDGGGLSVGERQRLGIARALYGQPRVLVLDEPTSALDPLTEDRLRLTFETMRSRLTVLLIAHQLRLVRTCDRIYVLEGGHLSDTGSFHELMERSDLFQALVRIGNEQSSGEGSFRYGSR